MEKEKIDKTLIGSSKTASIRGSKRGYKSGYKRGCKTSCCQGLGSPPAVIALKPSCCHIPEIFPVELQNLQPSTEGILVSRRNAMAAARTEQLIHDGVSRATAALVFIPEPREAIPRARLSPQEHWPDSRIDARANARALLRRLRAAGALCRWSLAYMCVLLGPRATCTSIALLC